jgi:predicted RNase H-like nuclease
MEYSKLIGVTGLSGLFELVSSKNDGAIVKNLETGATQFVSSRKHQFSHLESIEIYTQQDNVNLVELFQAMKAAGKDLPDPRDNGALKTYFAEVYPDMDFDRVYTSDMRKMVKWFGQIEAAGIELKLRAQEDANEETAAE